MTAPSTSPLDFCAHEKHYANVGARLARNRSWRWLGLVFAGVLVACSTDDGEVLREQGVDGESRWIAAWGATRETSNSFSLPIRETTVRNIVRLSAGGSALRLRLFNLNPNQAITIGAATVGIREPGTRAALRSGSLRNVTFDGGKASIVIPPNTTSLFSDPIPLEVATQEDLAVSLYLVGADNPLEFGAAWNESYKRANDSGDSTADESGSDFGLIDGNPGQFPAGTPLRCNGCRAYALRDVEVLTNDARGAMVFLGSSSFHGANTSQNGFARVSDLLALRLHDEFPADRRQTVVNRGMSGDTLEAAYAERMERDVWSTTGLDSVVVWVTNDLSERSADAIIATYRALIADAHQRGVAVFCPTWLPGAQNLAANLNGERAALNDWILHSGECDGVVDYAAAVEAPGGLTFLPQFNSGDFVHSNDAGHAAWAAVTPLADWLDTTRGTSQ